MTVVKRGKKCGVKSSTKGILKLFSSKKKALAQHRAIMASKVRSGKSHKVCGSKK